MEGFVSGDTFRTLVYPYIFLNKKQLDFIAVPLHVIWHKLVAFFLISGNGERKEAIMSGLSAFLIPTPPL